MKTGKGVVKKYSREYNRTLKNGEKKKYTTKQIQIYEQRRGTLRQHHSD